MLDDWVFTQVLDANRTNTRRLIMGGLIGTVAALLIFFFAQQGVLDLDSKHRHGSLLANTSLMLAGALSSAYLGIRLSKRLKAIPTRDAHGGQ